MSYILEALKKSERERARGSIPTLETVAGRGVSRKPLWLGVLIGAGALSGLVAMAWLVNLQWPRWSVPAPDDKAAGAAGMQQPPAAAGDSPDTAVRVQSAGTRMHQEGSTKPAPRRVDDIGELDPASRARVKALSINVVSYSDVPERRFVMLNQRIIRESESAGDGVVVKRILPEGALLSVGDYEILIGPD